jgi:CBS domain-containing protein
MPSNTVSEIMTREVVCFDEDDGIIKIANAMKSKRISCVIIKKGHSPVGIITERDMTYKVVAGEMDLYSTRARDVMSSPIQVIPPEVNIFYASQLMKKTGVKRFPIVKNKKLVGIITQSDIIRFFNEAQRKFVIDSLRRSGIE